MTTEIERALAAPMLRWLVFVQASESSKKLVPILEETWSKLAPMFGTPRLETVQMDVQLKVTGSDSAATHQCAKDALWQICQKLCEQIEQNSAELTFASMLDLRSELLSAQVARMTLTAATYAVASPAQLSKGYVVSKYNPAQYARILVRMQPSLSDSLHNEARRARVSMNALCLHKLSAALPPGYAITPLQDTRGYGRKTSKC